MKTAIDVIFSAADPFAVPYGTVHLPNTAAHCKNYCLQTDEDPEQLLLFWVQNEFQLPPDLRVQLQYAKLEVLPNAEFWARLEQGVTPSIELNYREYAVHMQSHPLTLRTAPLIGVSYRQYCGLRYAVAHVWNSAVPRGAISSSASAISLSPAPAPVSISTTTAN